LLRAFSELRELDEKLLEARQVVRSRFTDDDTRIV
jgi:hypothetical protein